MPTFCFHITDIEAADGAGTWGDCESGVQLPRYWVCVDSSGPACSDGPYYFGGDYYSDPSGWTALTGHNYVGVPNTAFTTGEFSGGGGGEDEGWLPSLTLAEGGLIAAAIAGLWALGMCLRFIRKMLEES